MAGEWIVVGASQSAPQGLAMAQAHRPNATTITTNGGLRLFSPGNLDYYLLIDMVACDRYSNDSKAYQADGTTLVTLDRLPSALAHRGLSHFDELLSVDRHQRGYVPDIYTDCGFSGLFCTQFALNNGATRLSWVGMEGFRSTPRQQVDDHFHGQLGPAKGVHQTERVLGPFLQSVVDQRPDVEFRFYGTPLFSLAGPNLTIIATEN